MRHERKQKVLWTLLVGAITHAKKSRHHGRVRRCVLGKFHYVLFRRGLVSTCRSTLGRRLIGIERHKGLSSIDALWPEKFHNGTCLKVSLSNSAPGNNLSME